MCFYINERWCTDVTVLKKMCCSDLVMVFINCKPFYSPREFCSFILVSVYIPPQVYVNSALHKLTLQACLDLTDWSVFEAAANHLDELTETVTSYISFCEDLCIHTRPHLTYNNDKPWFTAKLRQLRQAKKYIYRKGYKVLNKQAKYTLEKEIRVAKRNYSKKLRIQFSSSDSASVWKGMKDITSYNTPSPSTVKYQQQADNLNEFYCRFKKTPHTRYRYFSTQP